MTRQQLFAAFFFAAFLFLLFQLYSLFSAFLVPLTWTVILVLTFYPLYTVLLARLQGRRTLSSLLLTLLVILVVAVPVFLLSGILAAEVLDFYQRIRAAAESGELRQTLASWRETSIGRLWEQWGPRIEAFDIDIPALASEGAKRASQFIVSQVTGVARNVFVFLFDFVIISFSLFFLFRDGEESYRTIRDLIPMEPAHKEAIFHRLYETVSAVVQGMAATAVAQGLLAGLGFWAVGMPFSFFLACASAFFSLLPMGGAAAVWVPCVLYLGFTGAWVRAIILLVYSALIVSGVDNVLKPLIIGERTKLPTLMLFFGILGGLQAYGFLGIFLGPVVLATIMAFVKIYKEVYAQGALTP